MKDTNTNQNYWNIIQMYIFKQNSVSCNGTIVITEIVGINSYVWCFFTIKRLFLHQITLNVNWNYMFCNNLYSIDQQALKTCIHLLIKKLSVTLAYCSYITSDLLNSCFSLQWYCKLKVNMLSISEMDFWTTNWTLDLWQQIEMFSNYQVIRYETDNLHQRH